MDPVTAAALISAGSSLIGGWLQGKGQEEMSAEDRAHQLQMLLGQMGNSNEQAALARGDANARTGLTTANTAPNRVNWRQNQAISNAIMPQLRNVNVSSSIPGMNAFIPQVSGGLRIPEGGFSPDTLKFFSENAMLQGEKDLDLAGGRVAQGNYQTPSYGSIYGSPQAGRTQGAVQTANANLKKQDEENHIRRQVAMISSLQPKLGRR